MQKLRYVCYIYSIISLLFSQVSRARARKVSPSNIHDNLYLAKSHFDNRIELARMLDRYCRVIRALVVSAREMVAARVPALAPTYLHFMHARPVYIANHNLGHCSMQKRRMRVAYLQI